ncbi:hypothetical protein vseg_017083 [Gypsophila vaccaria]
MANEELSTTTTTTPQVIHDGDNDVESFTNNYSSNCCSFFPCFGARPSPTRPGLSSSSPSVWERLHRTATSENKWWAGPLSGLKKAREWSEIMAGPKWKTFIRRFHNNNNNNNKSASTKTTSFGPGKFQYDALSYSLNFDDGQGYNRNLVDESGYFPDFSSRFASVPSFCRASVDFGKTATTTTVDLL